MIKSLFVFIFLSLQSNVVLAEDMRQFLGGTLDEETELQKDLKKPLDEDDVEGQAFIPNQTYKVPDDVLKEKQDSPFIPETELSKKDFDISLSEKEEVHSTGTEVLGAREKDRNYLEFKNSELIRDVKYKGDKNFALTFFKDSFNYNGSANFDKTFRSGSSNEIDASAGGKKITSIPLMIRLSGHELFMRTKWLRLGAGAGLSVGYNGGKGYFSDGSMSSANISLWTLPVDGALVAEIPLGIIKLSAFGGPSVLGLIQNRSDLPNGNEKKNIRQASLGYFAGAKMGISITDLFPSSSYDFFGSYQVTRYYLSFEARTQNYSDFKTTDLTVTGTSYGVGFTFEYF